MENKDQNSAVLSGQALGDFSNPPNGLFDDGGVVKAPPLDTNALSLEPGIPEPLISQEQPKRRTNAFLRFVRRVDVILVVFLVLGAAGLIFTTTHSKESSNEAATKTAAEKYGTIEIPLDDLVSGKNLTLAGAANVTINGPIQLNDSLLLAPSLQPTGAKAGQIYYDQATNQLAYFNGSNFVFLTGQTAGGVQSLGGATGLLAVGSGLSMTGNQLTNTGVLSVQGQGGPVTFTAGPGIVINGTNFSNSGVISVSSDDPDVTVTSDGSGNVKISVAGAGTGTITSSGGSAGYLPVFTASQNIEDSIVTQSGLTVTITGDLSVVTGGLTLSNALTVSNGGTGATSLAGNGVLVGQGTAAVTSVTAGGAGLCLLSTAGAPTWAACPSGSGVSSLNGLTGGLSIANASGAGTTITIDDASTVNKGIASFNSTNFTVTSGAVNTVQNINSGATPTFAGLNTNSITPSAALTVGSISQTALLQGTTTTITSNGAGNDIVLNSADTIELQDNTNIAGNLDISGTIAIGTGNAFQVDASGTVTSLSTATFQGGSLAIGAAAQAGSLVMHDGSANTGTLQVAALGQNTVYTLPDPGAGSATICLSTGNCAGTGGGVTTAGGTTNRLAKFSGAQAIADSTISDDGTNVTTSVDLIIQGGDVTVGVAASQTASINLAHSGSSFLGTFLQGALTANRTYTLPDASGTVCLSSGNCSGSGSANTLQAAYDAGNTIATTDSRDIAFTLANTTADSNFTVTVDSGSTGFVAISRANGGGAADPAQLLLVQNVDTDRAQPVGISVQAATGGGMTTGIDVSDADITDAINVGANNIVGTTGNIDLTNFDVVGSTGTITTAGDIAVNGGDITSSGALNITPGGTLTVGVTGQQLVLQGSANTQLTATGSGFTTTVGFTGIPTANVTYNFDRTASAGTYTICTDIGNCAGAGGGVTTSGGTTGTIAKFTGSQTLGDSLLSESGSVVTVNGNLNITTGNQFTVNGTQISSANLSNDANLAKLSASQTFTGNSVAFQNAVNSTNAFNVQNAAGSRILTVDTTNAQVVLGVGTSLDGSIVFHNMSNANTVTILPGTPTGNRTLTLPDASGIICTDSGNCAGAGATLQTAYNFSVGGTTPKIKLNSTLLGFDIQDADTTIGANLLNIRDSNGAGLGSVMFGVGNTGAVTLQNSSNSTAAFRLLTSGGTNVLAGDTTNGRIILGQSSTLTGTLVFNNSTNANAVTLTAAAATGAQTITLPDASGTVCLTSGNCTGAGSSNTLQAAYDAGNTLTATTGRDVLITLADLATDPNFIINLQCDTACGGNGRFALQDDGVDIFTVSPAGGAIAIQPTTDTATAFNMKTALGNNMFTIDTVNNRVGIGLGASTLPTVAGAGGVEIRGALRLSAALPTYADDYVTPNGSTVKTMINILNYDPGDFNQLIAMGLPSTASSTARVISLLDARATTHQPTLAVISPNENEIGGFSWDGSSTDFKVKNSMATGSISLNIGGTDRLTASSTTVTINGAITQSGGAISMTGNNTSSISTTTGTLTLQSVNTSNNIVINGGSNSMTLNTGASGTITVGSSNTSTVNIGAQTNNARTINIGNPGATSQAQTVNIGATAGTGTTSIYSGTGGTMLTSTGSTTIRQSGTATAAAFQIQNTSGTNLMTVGTIHNTADLITNGSLEQNSTGWSARGSSTVTRTTSQAYIGSASLQVATTAVANDGAKYNVTLTASTQYTASFYVKLSSGTFTTLNYGYSADGTIGAETDCKAGQQAKTGGWVIMNCTFTTAASVSGTPYFYMKQTDATARTFYLDAFQIVPGADIGVYYEGKINTGGLAFTGPVAIQNDNDSQSVFQIQDSSGQTLFGVDAVNKRVGIGMIKAQATLDVISISTNSVAMSVMQSSGSTQDIVQLGKGTTPTLTVAHTGATTIQNNTDSAAAFRILNAAGMPQFVVDTSTSTVYVGDLNGESATDLIVRGNQIVNGDINGSSFSGAGLTDCDASNAKLLYDATTSTFSCGTDRASFAVRKAADETVNNSSVMQDDDDFAFSIGANETWAYQIYADVASNATADFKATITAPAGSTCRADFNNIYNVQNNYITNCGETTGVIPHSDAGDQQYIMYGTVVSGANSGTVHLQWAQQTATAINTTMRSGGYMVAYKLSGADLAEAYYTKDSSIMPGDIVKVDGSLAAGVKKSESTYDSGALGIVSTEPGMVFGDPRAVRDGNIPVLLALSGRVPVKVSLENGPIRPGDYLTTSSTPGVAMKATRPGQMIGKALAGFDSENAAALGTVMTFANLTWADPTTGATANNEVQGSTATDINASGTVTTRDLVVTNRATMNDLVVGSMTAGNITVSGNADIAGDINLQGVGLSRNAITKRFKASKAIAIGAVVIADPDNDGQVTTTTLAADTRVLGVALTAARGVGDEIKVAIGGSVQVKVAPGAQIVGGDLLVSSPVEGAAQETTGLQAGSLIGKALGRPANDMAWVLISLQ